MKRNLHWLDRIMLAVTFAEAGCPELAGEYTALAGNDGKGRIVRPLAMGDAGRKTRTGHLAAQR